MPETPQTLTLSIGDGLADWLQAFRAAANSNDEFQSAAEWLDLRILFCIGPSRCWFKIYRGLVIDAMPYSVAGNRLGYQVVASAADATWNRIALGNSGFARENATGALALDGQRVDADMAYRALVALGEQVLRQCGLPPRQH